MEQNVEDFIQDYCNRGFRLLQCRRENELNFEYHWDKWGCTVREWIESEGVDRKLQSRTWLGVKGEKKEEVD